MDLQEPTNKMSTTGGTADGTVLVLDDPATIEKKIKRAVTDSGSDIVRADDKPGVTNLIEILAIARAMTPAAVEEEMRSARGYGDLKAATAQAVVEMLSPLQERYADLRGDERRLEEILAEGAEKARAMARETLADVREAMGVGAPRRACDASACSSAPSSSSTRCSTRRSRRCCPTSSTSWTSARTAPACWRARMPPAP
jgi:tryptophanyl-tRNA synthetase